MKTIQSRRYVGFAVIGLLLLAARVSAEEREPSPLSSLEAEAGQAGEANRWNPTFVYGSTKFTGSDAHQTFGATFRIRLTSRLSIEPELRYMTLPTYESSSSRGAVKRTHSDIMAAGHLVYDFRDEAESRFVPYVMGGVGWIQVREVTHFTPIVVESSVPVFPPQSPPQPSTNKSATDAWWLGGSFGLRIMIPRSFFVSPEVRLGYAEGEWIGSAVIKVGYGF